jgi:hypothetical protein
MQIIPHNNTKKKPFGTSLVEGLTKSLPSAIESLISNHRQQKSAEQQRAMEKERIQKQAAALGISEDITDPKVIAELASRSAKDKSMNDRLRRAGFGELASDDKSPAVKSLISGEGQQNEGSQASRSLLGGAEDIESTNPLSKYSDEKLAKLAVIPEYAPFAKLETDRRQFERKLSTEQRNREEDYSRESIAEENRVAREKERYETEKERKSRERDEDIARESMDEETKRAIEKEKRESEQRGGKFSEDRAFHARLAIPAIESNEKFKKTFPEQERNLNIIRSSAPDVSTQDYLADLTGFEPLRTLKGAQFGAAVKNFFITDVAAITGQKNKWIEQQIKSALPTYGKSPEANIAIADIWQTKLDVEKKRSENFDKLRQQDMENFGYVRDDIDSRADEVTRPFAIQRDKQLAYDLRKQYENEDPKRVESLDKVTSGTPLTLEKARYLVDKFADQAEEVAKKLGYDIPSPELYQRYVE